MTSVLGQGPSWALDLDGPRLDIDGNALRDVQSLNGGDVFHFCPVIPSIPVDACLRASETVGTISDENAMGRKAN